MGLRRQRRKQRRNLVVWSQSRDRYRSSLVTQRARPRRIRRWLRLGVLLPLLGVLTMARGVRARWKLLLAGTLLTVAGLIMRGSGPGSGLLLPGLMLLLSAPLLPGAPSAERMELERELAGYWTSAQRHDLEAMLDRYPDDATRELREILAGQPVAAGDNRFPVAGRDQIVIP
jgi:hypothetical protein